MIRHIAFALLAGALLPLPALAQSRGTYEVYGVEEDDLLKMRAGAGTGFKVIVGLPNGTVVRVSACERTGPTVWCAVALDRARGLKGYVSGPYIREVQGSGS